VRGLRARYALNAALPSMRSVGYRQAWEHLEGRYDARTLRERGIAATRQLAKRQLTWLRAMDVEPIDSCAADVQRVAAGRVEAALDAAR
jgi:tRNA dimethylallyltransferase